MTNETKHTPGPWHHDTRNWSVIASGRTICDIPHRNVSAMHDAQLIARAPSLLAENETLRQQNAELVRALAFVRDDLNSELDYETRLIVESALATVQS